MTGGNSTCCVAMLAGSVPKFDANKAGHWVMESISHFILECLGCQTFRHQVLRGRACSRVCLKA